jgi:DNA-binding CsgD family transcriptional regulator
MKLDIIFVLSFYFLTVVFTGFCIGKKQWGSRRYMKVLFCLVFNLILSAVIFFLPVSNEKLILEGVALLVLIIAGIIFFKRVRTEKKISSSIIPEVLTDREKEVLKLVIENPNITNQEIGDLLYISKGTVSTHLSKIYTKLKIESQSKEELVKKYTSTNN